MFKQYNMKETLTTNLHLKHNQHLTIYTELLKKMGSGKLKIDETCYMVNCMLYAKDQFLLSCGWLDSTCCQSVI